LLEGCRVRIASNKDLEKIFEIEKKTFKEDAWSKEIILAELNNKEGQESFLVEKNNELVAYLMINVFQLEYHIINFAVSKLYQNNGIGKMLLKFFLDKIPNKSFVFLEVKQINFKAINLYESVGFTKQYIRDNYYSDGASAVILSYSKIRS